MIKTLNMNETVPDTYFLKNDDILYFLHIPKTGGTTLSTYIQNHFDHDLIYPETQWWHLLMKFPENYQKYKLFLGHFGYYLYNILGKKPIYITMLRDPIKRTVSDFENIKRNMPDELVDFFSKGKNISDFLNEPHWNWRLTNLQVRYIATDRDVISMMKPILDDIKWPLYYITEPQRKLDGDKNDEELYEIAKTRLLSDFAFFGIQDRYEDSMLLLSYTFGWLPITEPIKLNIGQQNYNLEPNVITEIKKYNKYDEMLYNFAKEVFEFRFNRMMDKLKERYYKPEFSNMSFYAMLHEMLRKHHIDSQKQTILTNVEYDFKSQIRGEGWHFREFKTNDGHSYRWTGPTNKSTIYFDLETSKNYVIRFRVINYLVEGLLDKLLVEVNDKVINIKSVISHDGISYFEGIIPRSFLQKHTATKISLIVDMVTQPSLFGNSHDIRKLGIAIDWLKIMPEDNMS